MWFTFIGRNLRAVDYGGAEILFVRDYELRGWFVRGPYFTRLITDELWAEVQSRFDWLNLILCRGAAA